MSIQSPVRPQAALDQLPPRVVVEGVSPMIDGGAFPIKRVTGESVVVEADVHGDGHDLVAAVIRYRSSEGGKWHETSMNPLGNDRFMGQFSVDSIGRWQYCVNGWVDRFGSWQREIRKKHEAGQKIDLELLEGSDHVAAAALRASGDDEARLEELAAELKDDSLDVHDRVTAALSDELSALMDLHADRSPVAASPVLEVIVEVPRALYGSWYEFFPRSASPDPNRSGTFADCVNRLPYIADMGFDVIYLPPIHPIGRQFRKGPNNSLVCSPDDPGSPWAIGGEEGGHTAILPELGTFEDFAKLVEEAEKRGIQIALDIAFQCSPDHPWVTEHPGWFKHRPDGTIKYAENPPKKYQDIYPIDFECEDWRGLWAELRDVFFFWIERGVKVFRVDNPHTKHFRFWQWCLDEIKAKYPDTIFLSEAFTRPKVMKWLAKAGYSQSYTYFTWRTHKQELTEYLTELTKSECREYMRPNFFANTPDILHGFLQLGGRAVFQLRAVLAATMSASWGIYGPPYELCVSQAVREGSEEYLDSEKYQQRHWDLNAPHSLKHFIGRINRARRDNPALQQNWNLRFFHVDNDSLIAYGKWDASGENLIVTVVNLDPNYTQSGWLDLPLDDLQLSHHEPYQMHDLLNDARYVWQGSRNFVMLNPHECPAHVFRVRRNFGSEQRFDGFA